MNNIQLTCPPLPIVRMGFIGLGRRGKQSFRHYMHIEGAQIRAVCDLHADNLAEAEAVMREAGQTPAQAYSEPGDWQLICQRDDIDLIYVCTNIRMHADIAVYAMEHGKHVAVEVPIANTVADCRRIVDTAERYRRHCMMLENCCYERFHLAVRNLCRAGVLGELMHAEGSYVHDLHDTDFDRRPYYLDHWRRQGNPYPTHGFGPLCQTLGIHRGDRLAWLVSVSNKQFIMPRTTDAALLQHCALGNINTTIVKTVKGRTIVLQNDLSSPRPYERKYLLSGTRGFVSKGEPLTLHLQPEDRLQGLTPREFLAQYDDELYRDQGERLKTMDTHNGMDYLMDYRLIHCLQQGLPLDMDVYDAVEWSCLVELTARSVEQGSVPVEVPDFTRGNWEYARE